MLRFELGETVEEEEAVVMTGCGALALSTVGDHLKRHFPGSWNSYPWDTFEDVCVSRYLKRTSLIDSQVDLAS